MRLGERVRVNYRPIIGDTLPERPQRVGFSVDSVPRFNTIAARNEQSNEIIVTRGRVDRLNFYGSRITTLLKGGSVYDRKTITVVPGEDIQKALDDINSSGGGTLFLAAGVHTPGAKSLTVYSNTKILGDNVATTIINFENGAYSMNIIGTSAYSTGTVTTVRNSTIVVGSGTSWSSNVTTASQILLDGIWYPISSVDSDTQITLTLPYAGANLAGGSYKAAVVRQNVTLEDFTIIGSAAAALVIQYANETIGDTIYLQASATGLDVDDSSQLEFSNFDITANNNGANFNNVHYVIFHGNGIVDTLVGTGLVMTTCTNWEFDGSFILNSAGGGVTMTSCEDLGIVASNSESNGSHGWELVSGNKNIVFNATGAKKNGSSPFLDASVEAYYQMNGAAASAAKLDNAEGTAGYDLVESGGVSATTGFDGVANGGYDFDGTNGYLTAADQTWLSGAAAATFDFWFKPDTVTGDDTLINQWNAVADNCFIIERSTTRLRVYIAATTADGGSNYGETATGIFAVDTWYSVSVVYDGAGATDADRLKVYVNGVLKSLSFTGTIDPALTNSATVVGIGRIAGGAGYYDGKMDEVRFSSVARTAAEVLLYYNASHVAISSADGFKLTATSDECIINACIVTENNSYGVNIAAATCDNNIVTSNILRSNITSGLNDSGTSTTAANNES